jgi:hypothetical protein
VFLVIHKLCFKRFIVQNRILLEFQLQADAHLCKDSNKRTRNVKLCFNIFQSKCRQSSRFTSKIATNEREIGSLLQYFLLQRREIPHEQAQWQTGFRWSKLVVIAGIKYQ